MDTLTFLSSAIMQWIRFLFFSSSENWKTDRKFITRSFSTRLAAFRVYKTLVESTQMMYECRTKRQIDLRWWWGENMDDCSATIRLVLTDARVLHTTEFRRRDYGQSVTSTMTFRRIFFAGPGEKPSNFIASMSNTIVIIDNSHGQR